MESWNGLRTRFQATAFNTMNTPTPAEAILYNPAIILPYECGTEEVVEMEPKDAPQTGPAEATTDLIVSQICNLPRASGSCKKLGTLRALYA